MRLPPRCVSPNVVGSGVAPLIGVLALQGDVREHQESLTRLGARTCRVKSAQGLVGLDGLIIPGGESTTIGKLAVLFGLMAELRAAVADGLPVFGSCAGMILLADRVLDQMPDQPLIGGLDVTVRRNAFGPQVASFEMGVPIDAVGEPDFPAVFIRAPWVEQAGPAVTVLATVPGSTWHEGSAQDTAAHDAGPEEQHDPDRIVAVRGGPLLATAFHPELTHDDRMHGYFVQMVKGQV
ncbi:MAG: pyridoxal 5'-phosphate synthase glutaminase subunit PdxT [Actinomycetes bacterium]